MDRMALKRLIEVFQDYGITMRRMDNDYGSGIGVSLVKNNETICNIKNIDGNAVMDILKCDESVLDIMDVLELNNIKIEPNIGNYNILNGFMFIKDDAVVFYLIIDENTCSFRFEL